MADRVVVSGVISERVTVDAMGGGAQLDSPAFTGTPTAPTAPTGTSTTQLATTAFVAAELDGGTW